MLAQKSYDEGGCPIGTVIVNNATQGNTLTQENHPYNRSETSATHDAGRLDFRATTIYTSLSPCQVCATLLYMRGFSRVVVGDITNASGTETLLVEKGMLYLEDQQGIETLCVLLRAKADQDLEDRQRPVTVTTCNNLFGTVTCTTQ